MRKDDFWERISKHISRANNLTNLLYFMRFFVSCFISEKEAVMLNDYLLMALRAVGHSGS